MKKWWKYMLLMLFSLICCLLSLNLLAQYETGTVEMPNYIKEENHNNTSNHEEALHLYPYDLTANVRIGLQPESRQRSRSQCRMGSFITNILHFRITQSLGKIERPDELDQVHRPMAYRNEHSSI